NAYWIVMTSIIILKPGYSLTKQRNVQRIVGTLIGCAASLALIYTVREPHVLIAFMFASMVMSYSLLLFNYAASVVFTSSYVLLLFHLLAPGNMRIIGERAIDTVVGCMIAIAASRLFPYWEYRAIGKLVADVLATTRKYFEATWRAGRGKTAAAVPVPVPVPVADGAAAVPAVAAVVDAAAPGLDGDYQYRLARKNVHIAFANLGQAFQRMMLEPKAHQKFVPELNDLLVQTHVLGAQITAAAPLLRHACEQANPPALERGMAAVREHLERAEAGAPPPPNQADATRQLTRELDSMVVDAERSDASADLTHDLKVLAHQCKQMLASSLLIRKDASVIRLPE
ncbi:FUSC family protein, partial [Burkholderia humptydooensis]